MDGTSAEPAPRADRRTALQLRPMACEQGLLYRADGSIRYSQGSTAVVVSVFGPTEVSSKDEKIDESALKIAVLPASGRAGAAELEIAEAVRQCMEHIVLTHLHPRTGISITIQVLTDAGALLACAINGTVLALVDAGLPMGTLLGAVDIVVSSESTIVDPLKAEESGATLVSLAFAEASDDIAMLKVRGRVDPEVLLTQLVPLGRAASRAAIAFIRLTAAKNVARS